MKDVKSTDFRLISTDYKFVHPTTKKVGKVRDNYLVDGDTLVAITTDRVSVFDKVVGSVPFKGQILNAISNYWFDVAREFDINTHFIKQIDPAVNVYEACKVISIKVVARRYLAGNSPISIWTHYEKGSRNYCGNILPHNLKKYHRFSEPLITPTIKAERDELTSAYEIVDKDIVNSATWECIVKTATRLFKLGELFANARGLILADTKYEFGWSNTWQLLVIDEINTPDSSCYWSQDGFDKVIANGGDPIPLSKDHVREFYKKKGMTRHKDLIELPESVAKDTSAIYSKLYKRLFGKRFKPNMEDPSERIERSLRRAGFLE